MQSITESSDKKRFMGSFGPRGLASIVFNEHLPGSGTITMTVVCTTALSVVSHGFSANPLVATPVMQIKGCW
jgi:NhaP-type Na+/H+ or K+/H+ antiporter